MKGIKTLKVYRKKLSEPNHIHDGWLLIKSNKKKVVSIEEQSILFLLIARFMSETPVTKHNGIYLIQCKLYVTWKPL
jgi:hypothetical protein